MVFGLPPIEEFPPKPKAPAKSNAEIKLDKQRESCAAKGGRWDPENNTCILPEGATTVDPNTVDSTEFGPIRDNKTGRLSGFERGGEIFVGTTPEETRTIVEAEANRQELAVGGQAETVLERRREQLQSEGLDLSAQVGNDPLQELESQFSAQQVSYVGAAASAVPGLIGGALQMGGTFAGGAIVAGQLGPQVATPEEVVTVPSAAIIGGIIGGIKGFYSDFVSDVKRQKGELIETPIRTLTETKGVMNDITGAQNTNPGDAVDHLEAFNSQLQLLDDEYDRLKDLTDDDLNKFLGDTGINQLQEYEVYFAPNGERDRQIDDFQLALANPDPARINPNTVTLKQINERIDKEIKKLQ